jgi:hypothetical protein
VSEFTVEMAVAAVVVVVAVATTSSRFQRGSRDE